MIKPLIVNAVTGIYRSEALLEKAVDNALKFNITVYDSLYVTLALNRDCKLASFDKKLEKQLKDAGLSIMVVP